MSKERARYLRQHLTDAESILWRRLRLFKKFGFHFRRQAPLGIYTVDFVCHRAKLIVELDGAHHAEQVQVAHDARRTRFLEARGYRVMRVWNSGVFANADGVAEAVLEECESSPTRSV